MRLLQTVTDCGARGIHHLLSVGMGPIDQQSHLLQGLERAIGLETAGQARSRESAARACLFGLLGPGSGLNLA